jgi:carboxymethylenebutenolidase
MIERTVEIATRDGTMTTFVVHPDRGGPFPVIAFLMDAPGYRGELRDMARRFATSGYYVLLPNLYYREGVLELGPVGEPGTPSRQRMYDLMETLSIPMVLADIDDMLAFASRETAADVSRLGTVGYCMSGRYAVCAAEDRPAVKATASIHGVKLIEPHDRSPHLIAKRSPAEFYFGCAERDHYISMEDVHQLERDLAGAHGEVELYPNTDHGFVFPKRPAVYAKLAAERCWSRLLALYERNLKAG